jgi:hypothetical protein
MRCNRIVEKTVPLGKFKKKSYMKKIFTTFLLAVVMLVAYAAGTAEIKFDRTSHSFGSFSADSPKVTCKFKFTNTGNGPLVIHQAIASCGCTVPQYPKEPIKPGESGEITVTYNGAGKFPGHFRKSITLRTNAKQEVIRLYVEGDMTPASENE